MKWPNARDGRNIKFKWYSDTDFHRMGQGGGKNNNQNHKTSYTIALHEPREGVNFCLQNIYWYHKNRIYISIDLIVNDFFCVHVCECLYIAYTNSAAFTFFCYISIMWHIRNIRFDKIIEQHFMTPSLVTLNVHYIL